MTDSDKTFRKTNPLFGFILALLFVALGIYLYVDVAERPNTANPVLVKVVGVACIVFFSGLLLLGTIKKFRKK
jgi:hypothetical protein